MRAIVINLDIERERMVFQKNQLDQFGIKFHRVSATSLSSYDDLLYKKYASSWERALRPSEVACFLSHKEAWEIAAKGDRPLLMLEDDACFAENINCILDELDKIKDIDYVNIEVTGSNSKKLLAKEDIKEFCDSKLFRMYQGRSGAGGYVLWPSGAKKLLNQSLNEKAGLADKFINANYSLLSYQLDPAVLIQLDQCKYHGIEAPLNVESTITPKSERAVKLANCNKCRLRRLLTQLKVGLNFLMHINHASKRQVTVSSLLFNLSEKNDHK